MNELFKKDITIKIGSVLIAVLFWLYVYNASNPYVPVTIPNVPLKIENENFLGDNGYVVKNKYKTAIDITIRGRQNAIDMVRPTDFEAVLDFSRIKSVNDKYLTVEMPVCSQKDVTIESYTPKNIDIQLARIRSDNFPVQLVNNIKLKPGYTVIAASVNPDTIAIVNEEAVIDTVGAIKATLDMSDVDKDINKKVNCKVYNKDGREITSLSRDLSVEVSVSVAKEVPVTLVTKGKLTADYVVNQSTVTPDKALITGPPEVLNKITDLKTEPVNIDNLNSDLSVNAQLVLPQGGVKLASTAKEAAVSITVEKLEQRDIAIPQGGITFNNGATDGSLNYEVKSENIQAQLKGRLADISGIDPDKLNPSVDVSGLGEGLHKLPLHIVLPSQVKLIQDILVDVRISKAETAPTQGQQQ